MIKHSDTTGFNSKDFFSQEELLDLLVLGADEEIKIKQYKLKKIKCNERGCFDCFFNEFSCLIHAAQSSCPCQNMDGEKEYQFINVEKENIKNIIVDVDADDFDILKQFLL